MMAVWLIIIGAAAGFLATRLMRLETGIVTTVAIGIAGALVGGLVLRVLLTMMGMLAGLVGAVLGALLLIWVWQTWIAGRK
ncbi:MAG: GlsB/YeaQ/YmgE family stress response membrane protein [Roseovarius sp.]|nr:GlsB/YeaQ/YmgE family stress response membrane protein [Roseovarius sp.]